MRKLRWSFILALLTVSLSAAEGAQQDTYVYGLVWSPDGTHLAALTNNAGLIIYSSDGTELQRLSDYYASYAAAWSPDGQWIAFSDDSAMVHIWDIPRQREIVSFQGNKYNVFSLAFNADGNLLAVGGGQYRGEDYELHVWNTSTWTENNYAATGRKDSIEAIAFSTDGTFVAYGGGLNDYLPICDAVTGELLVPIYPQPESVTSITFSPDGRYLSFEGRRSVQLWEIRHEPEFHLVLRHHWPTNLSQLGTWSSSLDRPLTAVTFGADGAFLFAWLEADGSITLRDISSGKAIMSVTIQNGPPSAASISPDGSKLAIADQMGKITVYQITR